MAQLMSIKNNVDVQPGVGVPAIFHCSQGDKGTRIILGLLNNNDSYTIPEGTTAIIRGSRADGTLFTEITADIDTTTEIKFNLTEDMTSVAGPVECEAVMTSGTANVIGTANFIIDVERSPASIGSVIPGTDAAETWLIDELTNLDISGLDNESVVDAINSKANESTIAPEFDSSTSYTAGQYVYKNGVLYRFTSTHSGAWTGTDVKTVTVGEELTDLKADLSGVKQDIINADLYDLRHNMDYYSENKNGIAFTWDKAQSKCTITGTATAVTFNNLFMSTSSLPANIKAGDVLRVKYKSSNVWLIFYDYSGGNLKNIKEVKRDCIVKIPDTCTGLIIRLWVGNGTTVNETVVPEIYKNANCLIESVDTATEDESGKTDMRSIIQEMIDIYRYCKLGPGAFYISDTVIIPPGGTLEGCGESTRIYLTSGDHKTAIMLRRYGAVRNLSVIGSYTDLTQSDFGASAGTRYGIHYYKGSSDTYVPAYCSILNVHIRNFTAAGIYQYGTGANVEQGLFVSNVHIKNCWCGIWIYSNSEFCRYENVQMTYCYIDCINNGGNNAFNNCVFHAYAIGMKIDGTQSNSAHGMCANSSFCHTGNNTGSALTLDSIANGFVFSSCQFWYNSVDISGCGGIVFSGCEFGRGTTSKGATINITNGNTVMFGNCVFMNDVTYPPDITITNNTKVKFNGCYGSVSGNEIAA